jgi:hypothetical protein
MSNDLSHFVSKADKFNLAKSVGGLANCVRLVVPFPAARSPSVLLMLREAVFIQVIPTHTFPPETVIRD